MIELVDSELSQEAMGLIDQISEQERIIVMENESRHPNWPLKKRAQGKIKTLCNALINKIEPSIGYLYLKALGLSAADDFRVIWQDKNREIHITGTAPERIFSRVGSIQTKIDLSSFPKYSFTFYIKFVLEKPYISKNDNDFYILDNPIQKDKLFQIPMMRPSGWKGALFGALYQMGLASDRDFIKRVFGEVKESEVDLGETGSAGRMHIFPSFFLEGKTGLEVINPRKRSTQAGTIPIQFEVVKQDSSSTFSLLYIPLDRIGKNEEETKIEVQQDLGNLLDGINGMFRTYGFGAKTSSGFGTAKDECDIEIKIKDVEKPFLTNMFSDIKPDKAKVKEVMEAIQEVGR